MLRSGSMTFAAIAGQRMSAVNASHATSKYWVVVMALLYRYSYTLVD